MNKASKPYHSKLISIFLPLQCNIIIYLSFFHYLLTVHWTSQQRMLSLLQIFFLDGPRYPYRHVKLPQPTLIIRFVPFPYLHWGSCWGVQYKYLCSLNRAYSWNHTNKSYSWNHNLSPWRPVLLCGLFQKEPLLTWFPKLSDTNSSCQYTHYKFYKKDQISLQSDLTCLVFSSNFTLGNLQFGSGLVIVSTLIKRQAKEDNCTTRKLFIARLLLSCFFNLETLFGCTKEIFLCFQLILPENHLLEWLEELPRCHSSRSHFDASFYGQGMVWRIFVLSCPFWRQANFQRSTLTNKEKFDNTVNKQLGRHWFDWTLLELGRHWYEHVIWDDQ